MQGWKAFGVATALGAILLCGGGANGQDAVATASAAVAAFDAKDWPAAAKLYQQVVDTAPNARGVVPARRIAP